MNLKQTDEPAELQLVTIPCRACKHEAAWVNFTEWDDERTVSYCSLVSHPVYLYLKAQSPNPDVMFDIYQCPECDEYTANLEALVWMDDNGNFYQWEDMDKIIISPDQLKLF